MKFDSRLGRLLALLGLLAGIPIAAGQDPAPPEKDKPVPREVDGTVERPRDREREEEDRRGPPPKERRPLGDRPAFRDGLDPFGPPRDGDGRRPERPGDGPPRPGSPFGPPGLRGDRPMDTPFGVWPGRGEEARLEALQKYDPELYELEKKDRELERSSVELGQHYRRLSPEQQRERGQAMKNALQTNVDKHFEVRQARRQLQLKRLEEELNRMRAAIERRNELRKQIVERRVMELIGEQNELDF